MENFNTYNTDPLYLTAEKVISPEAATMLKELVDEKGSRSSWDYNPDCVEFQIANPFSPHKQEPDEKVSKVLPELYSIGESFLRHGNKYFLHNACSMLTGYHGFWVLRYDEGGSFGMHCDWDSGPKGIRPPIVATACVLLDDDFTGGETLFLETVRSEKVIDRTKYGAVMWDGFTQHRIAAITEGKRYALVIHYTGTLK